MIQNSFFTLQKDKIFEGYYEEKKSKFFSFAKFVQSTGEIEDFLSTLSKNHPKAKHICYAYRVYENQQLYQKYSDDGEPGGTAGKPILNIIEKNELYNVVIVTVRYFGGTKLGAGNLLRAYSTSAKKAVDCNIVKAVYKHIAKINIAYLAISPVQALLNQNNIQYSVNYSQQNVEIIVDFNFQNKIQTILNQNNINYKFVEELNFEYENL